MVLKYETIVRFGNDIAPQANAEIIQLRALLEQFNARFAVSLDRIDKRIMCVIDPARNESIDFYIGDHGFSIRYDANSKLYRLLSAAHHTNLNSNDNSKHYDAILDDMADLLSKLCSYKENYPGPDHDDIMTFMDKYRLKHPAPHQTLNLAA